MAHAVRLTARFQDRAAAAEPSPHRLIFVTLTAAVLLAAATAVADDREEPIDIIIAVDKSLSMVEEIDSVKEYVQQDIVEQMLIVGDHLHLVLFYGKADVAVSQTIGSPDSVGLVNSLVGLVDANGRFTDIGNALDSLKDHVATRTDNQRQKYVLLITDGKQEAPPDSKYYSPDGTFNHEFLENARTIQREGWRIHIIGIGDSTVARELAERLSGTFSEVERADSAALAEGTRDLLRRVDIVGEATVAPVRRNGDSRLRFTVASGGTEEETQVVVDSVSFTSPLTGTIEALTQPVTILVPAGEQTAVALPLQLPEELAAGEYGATIGLGFDDGPTITPARFDVQFRVRTFIQDFWWMLLLALLLLLVLLGGAALAVAARIGAATIAFRVSVEGQTRISAQVHKLRKGNSLYLSEDGDTVAIDEEKTDNAIATLTANDSGLALKVLRDRAFVQPDEVPRDAFLEPFRVRLSSGRRTAVRVAPAA